MVIPNAFSLSAPNVEESRTRFMSRFVSHGSAELVLGLSSSITIWLLTCEEWSLQNEASQMRYCKLGQATLNPVCAEARQISATAHIVRKYSRFNPSVTAYCCRYDPMEGSTNFECSGQYVPVNVQEVSPCPAEHPWTRSKFPESIGGTSLPSLEETLRECR